MSLDITLYRPGRLVKRQCTGVYSRRGGETYEMTPEEVQERWPGTEIKLQEIETDVVWSGNITHNLNRMATAVGLYKTLWYSEKILGPSMYANDLIPFLSLGLMSLNSSPSHYKTFNPRNGWGDYEQLVRFVEDYLEACRKWPDALIRISR